MEFPFDLPKLIPLSTEAKSVLIASLVSLLILFFLQQWKRKSNNTKEKQPPMPSYPLPIIGHLHLLLKGLPHIALGQLADQCGPIFMVKHGVRRAIVVSSAEMAKQCLAGTNDAVFLNRPRNMFVQHMTYDGAMFTFNPYGQYWREMRKIVTVKLLSSRQVETFKSVRISEIRSAIANISALVVAHDEPIPIDMQQWFCDTSLNSVVRLVAGKSLKEFFQGEEYDRCAKAMLQFFEFAGAFVPADALPFLRWFDIGGYKRSMRKVSKQLDLVLESWLDDHKKRFSSAKEGREKRDFMDVLLGIFDADEVRPSRFESDAVIKATSLLMILAAADTTTVTLTWALSLLLNNKEVLKKTQAELDAVVGKERLVEESDLKDLVYLQSVLKETMRLYPAAPLSVPRESIASCTVSGYHIPAGTELIVNLYKIHRDPQVWDHPSKFDPQRFLLTTCKDDYDFRGGQNYEFMPFGSGRRMCPGTSFAQPTLQFTLASLLHGFEISTPSDETVDMTEGFGLTIQKVTPLKAILTQRLPHHLYI